MPDLPVHIKTNISLARYTTMGVGGPAKYFIEAKNSQELIIGLKWAVENKISIKILGNGSNVIVADEGYNGLIILMGINDIDWVDNSVIVGAGVKNGQLINDTLAHQLGGLAGLAGIPGTIGGAIYGNAGSLKWGIGDQVDWVDIIVDQLKVKRIKREECKFSYRQSIFKQHQDWIIVRAKLVLKKIDMAEEKQNITTILSNKKTSQPVGERSAGCIFTNPAVAADILPAGLREYIDPSGHISAWRLIEYVGLVGRQLGGAMVSAKHANFIINTGEAKADHIVQLISLIKQQVRDKIHVQLQEEIQYLGY